MAGEERDMIKLKSCPFCGGRGSPTLKPVAGGGDCVQCTECGCETNVEDNAFEAVAAWNRRTERVVPEEVVDTVKYIRDEAAKGVPSLNLSMVRLLNLADTALPASGGEAKKD